jgi:Pvc16 N-terminal domain
MTLGLLGLLDLSIVTDRLIKLLDSYRLASSFPGFTVTGKPPEVIRREGGYQLSTYLFHLESEKFLKNSPIGGPGAPNSPFQPLSLNLYYLLSAVSDNENGYVEEQQAMSVALRCFHENPIIRTNVILGGQTIKEEFCLTMEMEAADSMGRVWLSATTAMRLAAVYRNHLTSF